MVRTEQENEPAGQVGQLPGLLELVGDARAKHLVC